MRCLTVSNSLGATKALSCIIYTARKLKRKNTRKNTSEIEGEMFHQDIKTMRESYQGRWNIHIQMMVE